MATIKELLDGFKDFKDLSEINMASSQINGLVINQNELNTMAYSIFSQLSVNAIKIIPYIDSEGSCRIGIISGVLNSHGDDFENSGPGGPTNLGGVVKPGGQ